MIKFLSLASGSSGNCYFFTNGETSFMIDAGVGPRSSQKILSEHKLSLADLDFILVTHDHIDHIKALGIISLKFSKPVYTTQALAESFTSHFCTKNRVRGNLHVLGKMVENEICGVKVTPFPVPHDATETVGYFIEFDGRRITLVTDCGSVTEEVLEFAKRADTLIFESNYDCRMLECGPYTPSLKRRITDPRYGHLSNDQAAAALQDIYRDRSGRMDHLFLCHISGNNNTPELALRCVADALSSIGATSEKIKVECLRRGKASPLYVL